MESFVNFMGTHLPIGKTVFSLPGTWGVLSCRRHQYSQDHSSDSHRDHTPLSRLTLRSDAVPTSLSQSLSFFFFPKLQPYYLSLWQQHSPLHLISFSHLCFSEIHFNSPFHQHLLPLCSQFFTPYTLFTAVTSFGEQYDIPPCIRTVWQSVQLCQ